MKGTNLGEFEEIVLLTIAALMEEAYSVAICDEIEKVTGRKVKLSVVHAVLNRLSEKGYVWFVNINGILFKHQKE